MQAMIRHLRPDAEFYTSEQCYINELSNSADDADVSIARARVAAGVSTRWHRLQGITERYVIMEGQGLVEIGGLPPTRVSPGDVVVIPPQCPQRITSMGEQDLVFLAICTPRFQQIAYEDVDAQMSYSEVLGSK